MNRHSSRFAVLLSGLLVMPAALTLAQTNSNDTSAPTKAQMKAEENEKAGKVYSKEGTKLEKEGSEIGGKPGKRMHKTGAKMHKHGVKKEKKAEKKEMKEERKTGGQMNEGNETAPNK